MRVNKCLPVILFMLSGQALSATTVAVTDNEVQKIHLARATYNRIAIKDSRILSIKGENGNYDLQTDEQTGDVYLKPQTTKQFDLFITSESLEHYQLIVLPDEKATQTVLLKPKNKEIHMNNIKKDSLPYVEKIASLMKIMYSNKTSEFYKTSLLSEKPYSFQRDFKIKRVALYRGHDLTGEVLQVTNKQKQTKEIMPSEFAISKVIAVSALSTILKPKASTIIYRVLSND